MYKIEGGPLVGFRVVDDERGALTGRKATAEDALKAAGVKPAPTKPARTSRAK